MKITPLHRQIVDHLVQHGPATSRELADAFALSSNAISSRAVNLVAAGYLVEHPEFVRVDRTWMRQWAVGPVPLPAHREPPPLVAIVETPEERAARALFDEAVAAGLDPVQVPERGWRIAVAHPLGLPGRVWIDGPGDLEAVLRDRDRAEVLDVAA